MLTFETLRRVLEEEKANQSRLIALPENFWQDVRSYINAKSAIEDKEREWEIESAREIIQEIVETREAKLLKLAAFYVRSGIAPENLSAHEQKAFNSLVAALKEWRDAHEKLIADEPDLLFVTILQDMPEFIDEKRSYGPFCPGDVTSLPSDIAKLLVEKGVARIVEKTEEIVK